MKTSASLLVLLLAAACLPHGSLQAQSYPAKAVKIIVPVPPGGGTDTMARGLAQRLASFWNQTVLVENRPGLGAIVGAEAAAKSRGDGYTLLFTEAGPFVINPHLYKKLPYSPLTDFAPITVVVRLTPVLAVGDSVPARNVKELIAYAKAHPGDLTYGSFGSGSYPHIVMEQFKKMAGVDILHVPFKGSVGAITEIVGGRLSMMLATISVFAQQEKAGRLRILAAATDTRLQLRPDLPTIAESGLPGFFVSVWFGLVAPASTPPNILDRINADVVKVVKSAEFHENFLKPQLVEAVGNSREEFAAQLKAELATWGKLVADSGAKAE